MTDQSPLVYIVDDDASLRTALRRLLRSVGIEAEAFASAPEFLAHTRADRPGCVVLDVRMPRMSGLELQQAFAEAGIELPIIFVTGHGDVEMSVRAMKAGAVDFLQKPFHDQDLLDAIQRAIDGDRRRRTRQAEEAAIRRRYDTLTPREQEVLAHIVTGALNKQVAGTLGTSEKTIKVHRARIFTKMQAESLAELVRLAARLGIHGPGSA
ncbi:MAG: response regulator transcription factor [Candidatus Krumholzibacteriia bacterium]